MVILVQKFGGTSLVSKDTRKHVIRHIEREQAKAYQLVVVVSAMGRAGDPYSTDSLLALLSERAPLLGTRERDLLLNCGELISAVTLCSELKEQGIASVVMTGGQAGIITDGSYGDARIVTMKPEALLKRLIVNQVVVVTGFQGQTQSGELTTLGRGGCDTSATAIGAAVHAERVDIYTDVNGILTADPRIVENAKPLTIVGYAEICNMARQGAKVIHPRAVELAQQSNLPLRVRSTFSEDEGTLVTSGPPQEVGTAVCDRHVTGIAHVQGISQISVHADGRSDLQLRVFKAMADHQISVDFINVTLSGAVYTVFDHDVHRAVEVLKQIGFEPQAVSGCAKVSVIGGGMNGVPGVMARIVEALTEHNIQILQSADSNSTIWVLVKEQDMVQALRALHSKFELHL